MKLLYIAAICFSSAALLGVGLAGISLYNYPKITNPEFLEGYTLDLPEEISVIDSSKTDLEAYKRNDTIFIQFKD